MLSKAARLRAKEVEAVLSSGRSLRGGHLSMKFLKKSGLFRLAVVVPKSLARKASLRNRLRRAAYDAIPPANSLSGGHAVFFVRIIPDKPLRPVFKEEAAALLAKI